MRIEEFRSLVFRFYLPLAGEILINPAVEHGYFVPLHVVRDTEGRQRPSGKLLAELKRVALEAGAEVEYLVIDEEAQKLEDSMRSSLLASFPDVVRNSYMSLADGVAHLWIEKKRDLREGEEERLKNHARTYARLFNLRGAVLNLTSDFKLATNTEVLRAVRRLSPATCGDVGAILEEQGFSVPSSQWINHKFDALRKAGLLVRIPERQYALTSTALQKLGTIKSGRSPDVSRLLALARRRGKICHVGASGEGVHHAHCAKVEDRRMPSVSPTLLRNAVETAGTQ